MVSDPGVTQSIKPRTRPQIMGILNLTPDSFSDGGVFQGLGEALSHAAAMVDAGADFIDVGGESTRPGAGFIGWEEEWRRISGVLKKLCLLSEESGSCFKVSLDSWKPEVIERALDFGVHLVNSIKGIRHFSDDFLQKIASRQDTRLVAMHMHGTPADMQEKPLKAVDALREVEDFYRSTWDRLEGLGFHSERIFLDPGIGFGKTDAANLQLLSQAMRLSDQYQVMVGFSRKGFLGRLFNIDSPADRDGVGKILELGVLLGGVQMIRTHKVGTLRTLIDRAMND